DHNTAYTFAVNSDGSVVVGATSAGSTNHAVRWTVASGIKDLNVLLSDAGINMTGITLLSARAIASNGYIVGQANFPGGANHAYLVRYDEGAGSLSCPFPNESGLGDFNGDGRKDLVFRRTEDGLMYVYFMNGLQIQ